MSKCPTELRSLVEKSTNYITFRQAEVQNCEQAAICVETRVGEHAQINSMLETSVARVTPYRSSDTKLETPHKRSWPLREPSPKFAFFLSNVSEISTQYVEFNRDAIPAISFIFFILIFMIIAFFSKKKTPFPHSTKNSRSRWAFIVQIWFTYQIEPKTTRKRNSALFF